MRVKEGATGSAEMGKKRNRTKQTDYHNTSDEETRGKECSHVDKSVSLNNVKKGLKNHGFGQCSQCTGDRDSGSSVNKKGGSVDEVDSEVFETVVWLCLACGNQGCCRNSPAQHALKHFEAPRSNQHSLAVCLANWSVWCYKCDDAINPSDSKKLSECMDWIKRQALQQKPVEKSASKKRGKDEAEETHVRTASSPIRSPLLSREGSLPKVRGLKNLGNTCFFNAVMQNLTQTHVLRTLLHDKWSSGKQLDVPTDTHLSVSTNQNGLGKGAEKEPLDPITITVATLQPLTSSLIEFLDEMHKPTKALTINPWALFNQVCNKASRFKGYQQQDSHELLRYLLDGMKAEEIKRMQQGLQATFDVKKPSKMKNLDDATKKRIKEYGHHSKHTFVDTVFGGHLISSVKCNECHNISEILEPFLDLSLPIIEAKIQLPVSMRQTGKGSKRNLSSSKSVDRPSTGDQQVTSDAERQAGAAAVLVTPEPSDSRQLSKHQLQKQKEKARKESRRKTRRSRTTSQSEDAVEEKKDSPVQSENEEETREGAVGYRDPNDADSEASILERQSNAGSSRRCSEQRGGEGLPGGLPNSVPEVPAERENQEQEGPSPREKSVSGDRVSLGSRASTASSGSLRVTPAPAPPPSNPKTLANGDAGIADEEKQNGKGDRKPGNKTTSELISVQKEIAALSLNENGKDTAMMNGVLDDSDGKAVESRKGSLDSAHSKEDRKEVNGVDGAETKTEKLHGGNDRTTAAPSGVAPLAKIHELGETLVECNNVDAKADKCAANTAVKEERITPAPAKNSNSKGSGKTKPHPISTHAASTLTACNHNSTTSPPVSPVSPTSRARVASTLAPRYQAKNQECSVMSCLNQFTAPELLTGTNRFGCEICTRVHKEEGKEDVKYTDASKQLLIHQPPPILTLHLKRFQQVGYNLRKITRHIEFPLTLDVAPFCSSACKRYANSENRVLYSLYGVVEHSGRLQFGHYTAFVKVRQPNQKLSLYTLGIPRTLNLLNETCDRLRTEKNEERIAKEKARSLGRRNEDCTDACPGENGERKSDWLHKPSNSLNRNHIQSSVLPFHAGRNVSVPSGKWYYISDTHVSEVSETKVQSAQAYILFYERLIS